MWKVSVVVPIYNAEEYLVRCLDSIANQTLSDIEVICVNDGSSDSSLEIINSYVNNDPRFKLLDKKNSGYGDTMNRGFDMAQGEYLSIVEADDFIEPNMLEHLYSCAKENDLDVCKAGFFYYYSQPQNRDIECKLPRAFAKKGTFCPSRDIRGLKNQIKFFGIKPTIWSAIYKREFLRSSGIEFTKTPGASFQDTAFNFKVWALAKRVRLVDGCFLHYRQDNASSSVNSTSKVFCICDEMREIDRFLDSHGELSYLKPVMGAVKYDTYIWNYERLCCDPAREFLLVAAKELKKEIETGYLTKKALPPHKWSKLSFIVDDPEGYHTVRQEEKKNEVIVLEGEGGGSPIKRAIKSLKTNGLGYTLKKLFPKARGKKSKKKETSKK
ncbi:MAG: glycosyltransferase [Clostridia bacterium]|nr:glycosyltransferase [Clostridia bacterium]